MVLSQTTHYKVPRGLPEKLVWRDTKFRFPFCGGCCFAEALWPAGAVCLRDGQLRLQQGQHLSCCHHWPHSAACQHSKSSVVSRREQVADARPCLQALSVVLPAVAHEKVDRGGFMVLRPDSGDPVEAVLMALEAAEKVFGADTNSKGYKVIPPTTACECVICASYKSTRSPI